MKQGWFTTLTGIDEGDPEVIRAGLSVKGTHLTAMPTGRTMNLGSYEMPSLSDLRESVARLDLPKAKTGLTEIFGDVRKIHADPAFEGAVFQVASQFNMLEMVGPDVSPEAGINGYAYDRTQGPACAMACGAGTIWRQYLVPAGDGFGQTSARQLDGAADLHAALCANGPPLWDMRNGYLWPRPGALTKITQQLASLSPSDRDVMMATLRYAIHWQTEVTDLSPGPLVTQIYCSAAPVAYAPGLAADWSDLAQLILRAAYEATLSVAVLNKATTGCNRVVLTRLGGGAFGNPTEWIDLAIQTAIDRFSNAGLEVLLLTYRG